MTTRATTAAASAQLAVGLLFGFGLVHRAGSRTYGRLLRRRRTAGV
jgi:hypothetical protein